MKFNSSLPEKPFQRLPREAYISPTWFERERHELFGRSWIFAGVTTDFAANGDYRTVQAGPYPLFVLRNESGDLVAYHNLCRHRGIELLEGAGNVGSSIVCPYHYWAYNLDGSIRGIPNQRTCFPDLDDSTITLRKASVGVFKDLVFVHPEETPEESFDAWLADLADVAWPHDLTSDRLGEHDEKIVYEIKCNWKVFCENALDGYHLAYLHKKTLGGPMPDKNLWQPHGQHMVWYANEEGARTRMPRYFDEQAESLGIAKIPEAATPGYGGFYFFFPATIVFASAYSLLISYLEAVGPETTLLKVRSWSPKDLHGYRENLSEFPGYDKKSGLIRSANLTSHPLETGDFQTEDVWVCEKMQRALKSPAHSVGALAAGAGAESALAYFQSLVERYVGRS